MRLFTFIFTFIIITFLFGSVLNKIETIEQLEKQLIQQDSLLLKIDSLYKEIDTLQWENQIWDFNIWL